MNAGALRTTAAAVVASLALAAGGCGGDDDSSTATDTVEQAAGASYEIPAADFIVALEPEKREILRDYVASEPNNCSEVDDGFLLTVTARATEVAPDTPLDEVITGVCGEPETP